MVEESTLNRCMVRYATNEFVAEMYLRSSGPSTLKKSTSPGITNPFSTVSRDTTGDIDVRVQFSSAELMWFYQAMVNRGVCDEEPKDLQKKHGLLPYAVFDGKLNKNLIRRETRDPELLEIARRMLEAFESADQQNRLLRRFN